MAAAELDRLFPLPTPPLGWRGLPTTGDVRVFALLIDFADVAHVNSEDTIDEALFGTPPTGGPYESLSAYYSRASYGQLNISGATLGWYQTPLRRSEVDTTTAGREALIKEALTHFQSEGHDFSQYDNNGDGVIDYFLVCWAGQDSGWATFWWGYQTSFSDSDFQIDGVRLRDYSWQWESRPVGNAFNPRVCIHETGHALGLPDLYDYDGGVGPDGGVGGMDMMDANRLDHNCFSKWMLDWLEPTIIPPGSHRVVLSPSATSKDCVAIWPDLDRGDLFSELFMAQNRQAVANDTDLTNLGAQGLVIWHIDARLDLAGIDFLQDNSYTDHKLVRLMEADGLEEVEAGRSYDSGDFYAPGLAFGPSTTPSSGRYDGSSSFVHIDDIAADGSAIAATFSIRGRMGRVMVGDVSSGHPPIVAKYWEEYGESPALNGWLEPTDLRLVGDFTGVGHSQVMFINRSGNGGKVMIADFSAAHAPIAVQYWEDWGDNSALNGWLDPNDLRFVGDFMGVGHDQVMFVNRSGAEGKVMIADFSAGHPPIAVKYLETWGQTNVLNGWLDSGDVWLAGDFVGLGHDQVMFINRGGTGGKVMIGDFSSGHPPVTVKYWEDWGHNPVLNGWLDTNDLRLIGDFMGLGHDQVMFVNRSGTEGKVMIGDFSSGKPPVAVKYLEKWGDSPALNGWLDADDYCLVGDFVGLGHDEVMFINSGGSGGKVMVADFGAGHPPVKTRYWEDWGQNTALSGWLDCGDVRLAGDFIGVNHHQVLFINTGLH
jgi:M6 family metalloprotease-like protein